jgi:hypothetical protein
MFTAGKTIIHLPLHLSPPVHFSFGGGEEDGGKDDVFSRRSLMVPQVNLFLYEFGTMAAPRKK